MGRTTLSNLTWQAAKDTEGYINLTLAEGRKAYKQSLFERPGIETLVVELEGCEIRTGVVMGAAATGVSNCRGYGRVRQEHWREVRTGLVGPLDSEERLYVCRLDTYGAVCEQLFGVACLGGADVSHPGGGAW